MAELASFSEDLAKKPMMVVATKLDAAQEPQFARQGVTLVLDQLVGRF